MGSVQPCPRARGQARPRRGRRRAPVPGHTDYCTGQLCEAPLSQPPRTIPLLLPRASTSAWLTVSSETPQIRDRRCVCLAWCAYLLYRVSVHLPYKLPYLMRKAQAAPCAYIVQAREAAELSCDSQSVCRPRVAMIPSRCRRRCRPPSGSAPVEWHGRCTPRCPTRRAAA